MAASRPAAMRHCSLMAQSVEQDYEGIEGQIAAWERGGVPKRTGE